MPDYLKKLNEIKDVADERLASNLTAVEMDAFKRMMDELLKANLSGGKIMNDAAIQRTLMRLDSILNTALENSGYYEDVKSYLTNFDLITKNVSLLQKAENNVVVPKATLTASQNKLTTVTIDNLTGSGIDRNFVQPLRESLYTHVVNGGTIRDAEAILKKALISTPEANSTLSRYVGQVARDGLSQYEGGLQNEIARIYKMDARIYVGSLIKDSRGQCAKWVAMKIITDKELPHEIEWASEPSHYYAGHKCGGMIPGTTVATFNMNRGGYNCRHQVIATFSE